MRILQTHADFIEFEPIQKEIQQAEDVEKKKYKYDNVLVLFTSVEDTDDESIAKKAIGDVKDFLKKLKINKILIYPFAHLSRNLAPPNSALKIIKDMEKHSNGLKIETYRAPFGWNKVFNLKTKSHPLAEQSRVYGDASEQIEENYAQKTVRNPLALLKRSDLSGLNEKDHRVIGQQLDLYSFQEVGPGMVFMHPKGIVLRNILIDFWRKEHQKRGYQEISTPILLNNATWQVSGHMDHFRENMFFTEIDKFGFGLKPMNCAGSILVFKSKTRSYKDLPIRLSELGIVHRNELSGVLSGLFRLRSLTQDDAHIFVTNDRIEKEVIDVVDIIKYFYKIFGFKYSIELSTKPEKAMGDKGIWEKAESILRKTLDNAKLEYSTKSKEGAFYGPKIDFHIKDSMGRSWQLATVQLDMQSAERFGAAYIGEDGREHYPAIIHRVIYGAIERFIGILVEHYQGKFPLWLSPVQVSVLPMTDKNIPYATKIKSELEENGIRTAIDTEPNTIQYKIRNAQLQKILYMLVIGNKEEQNKTIAVRNRDGKIQYDVKLDGFLKQLQKEVKIS